MPPPLSIVVPSHSRADLLRLCLASVTRHAPPDAEVIVVDDGSRDGVVSATAGGFPGVRVVRRDSPGGFCAAVNAGVGVAAGAVVEVLNDDAEVTAGWAGPALAAFADPAVGAVAPLVLMGPPGDEGPARVDSAGDRYYRGGVAGKRGHGDVPGPELLTPGWVFGACAAAAFYRREALVRVGGFPEDLGAYFDDVDVSFRLHRAGYRVRYEPASRVHHRVSASYGPPRAGLLAQQSRNEELVFWRNLPAADAPLAVPLHLAVLAGKSLRRLREGTFAPFLRGRLAALGRLPEVLRHRRRLARLGAPARWGAVGVEARWWRAGAVPPAGVA